MEFNVQMQPVFALKIPIFPFNQTECKE